MNAAVECLAWVAGIWLLIAAVAACIHHRRNKRQPLPRRTPADVLADAAQHRDCRRLRQAIEDHDDVWAICPDPPNARVIETQHRLDTAKQNRKEEGQ